MRIKNPNTSALKFALECTLPKLQRAAAETIVEALESTETLGEAAAALGVNARVLQRLRKQFPGLAQYLETD